MTTKQLSIFLENKTGRLNDVAKILSESSINMKAFSIADNTDFGISHFNSIVNTIIGKLCDFCSSFFNKGMTFNSITRHHYVLLRIFFIIL